MRRILGLIMFAIGAYILYEASRAIGLQMDRGITLNASVTDPVILMRLVAGVAAVLGGGLAMLALAGAALFGAVAAFAFGTFAALILSNDPFLEASIGGFLNSLGGEEGLLALGLFLSWLLLLVLRRKPG